MVNSLFLQVGLLDQHLTRSVENLLSGIESDSLDRVDNPLVDLVGKLIQIDILVGLTLIKYAEDVDGIFSQHRGQLDVQTTLTDSQRDFLGLQVDLGLVLLRIQRDAGNLSR